MMGLPAITLAIAIEFAPAAGRAGFPGFRPFEQTMARVAGVHHRRFAGTCIEAGIAGGSPELVGEPAFGLPPPSGGLAPPHGEPERKAESPLAQTVETGRESEQHGDAGEADA